jgi:hypothetical protein
MINKTNIGLAQNDLVSVVGRREKGCAFPLPCAFTELAAISGFRPLLDSAQPHSPDERAAGINHAPVAGEGAARCCIRGVDASFCGEQRAWTAGLIGMRIAILQAEVHCRRRKPGLLGSQKLFEGLGRALSSRTPAARRGDQRAKSNLLVWLFSQKNERGLGCHFQQRRVRRRIENALRSRASQAAEPDQGMEEKNFFGGYLLERRIDLVFGRGDADRVELVELPGRHKLIKLRARRGNADFFCRQ